MIQPLPDPSLLQKYRLRMLRRRFLFRALRAKRQLDPIKIDKSAIRDADILCFVVARNEILRLPHFLDYHRDLGVGHFLFVDNNSADGTQDYLRNQADVSLWSCKGSYRESRFGLDWITWLQMCFGSGKWCLVLDVDELLVFPFMDQQNLGALTRYLDQIGQRAFGTLMIDLYSMGSIADASLKSGETPLDILTHFDREPFRASRQSPLGNLWVQGGVRERVFFSANPRLSPTLNKLPLVKWHWRYAYVNSTHSILPRELNYAYDGAGDAALSGALLHTKFLADCIDKSQEDLVRQTHFARPENYQSYYRSLIEGPDLWTPDSAKLEDWRQLEALGLISCGNWSG